VQRQKNALEKKITQKGKARLRTRRTVCGKRMASKGNTITIVRALTKHYSLRGQCAAQPVRGNNREKTTIREWTVPKQNQQVQNGRNRFFVGPEEKSTPCASDRRTTVQTIWGIMHNVESDGNYGTISFEQKSHTQHKSSGAGKETRNEAKKSEVLKKGAS